jgi:cobalt/nickel transport protein
MGDFARCTFHRTPGCASGTAVQTTNPRHYSPLFIPDCRVIALLLSNEDDMKLMSLVAAAAISLPMTASAHFLLHHTDEVLIDRPGDVPMGLIFWHPMENGHAMDMEKPEEFFMIHNGEKTDLMDRVAPATFKGKENEAAAFTASVPVKRSGDYVVVTKPAPYYEESEDIYIQQITKSVLNRNTLPTDWDQPAGLETEILPLNKPYNVIVGSTFSGVVLSEGKPVAGAEIEIEFMAAEPDLAAFATTESTVQPMAGGSIVAITDEKGVFTFGIPTAGHWGFAALGSGPAKEHNGKELSQDAVLWIHATELK